MIAMPSGVRALRAASKANCKPQHLMQAVDVVVATGGAAMVKSAYSSGKPSYGVGAGNVPVIIDRGVDLKDAVDKIVTWRGSPDLSSLRGRPIYLRFRLQNMGLFSFRVADE